MQGQVIGINDLSETYDNEGYPVLDMGYCIPIDEVQSLIQMANIS
jgi:S1-C subfamily serine protease